MATSTEDRKAHVRAVERIVNDQDYDLLSEIFAEDLTNHFHGGREEYSGRDEFQAYLSEFHEAFPDGTISIEQVVAEDDMVAVRYTGSGTHEGEFRGIPPTGEEVRMSGMRIVRFEDGKIAEVWGQRDDLGTLAQIGVVEPPAD